MPEQPRCCCQRPSPPTHQPHCSELRPTKSASLSHRHPVWQTGICQTDGYPDSTVLNKDEKYVLRLCPILMYVKTNMIILYIYYEISTVFIEMIVQVNLDSVWCPDTFGTQTGCHIHTKIGCGNLSGSGSGRQFVRQWQAICQAAAGGGTAMYQFGLRMSVHTTNMQTLLMP